MKKHATKKTKTTTSDTMDTPTPASTIVVSKDIPLPAARVGRYPFATMDVGDSFEVTSKYAGQAAYGAGRKLGYKFACRADATGVRRVWRTA